VTIAAVANDVPTLALALALGTALVEAGANVNLADRSGQTPLVLAQARGYDAMVAVLRRGGAR
jgi:ankyrin repeat protein